MDDKKFIEIAKLFLRYSFEDIDYEYKYLTEEEKLIVSKEDFNLFIKNIKDE